MTLPLAHAGHWLVDSLYAVPVIVLAAALWIQNLRDKRRERAEKDDSQPSD
ncbi:MAG TPA: hypothetical protein VNT22_04465 [Baekduia sp.]|nr:hypothetical protein [Baekduia sp.]